MLGKALLCQIDAARGAPTMPRLVPASTRGAFLQATVERCGASLRHV
jgi:hypothetical protein